MSDQEIRARKPLSKGMTALLLLAPSAILFLSLNIYPLVYNIWLSGHRVFLSEPDANPARMGLGNFVSIFQNMDVLASLARSAIYAVTVVVTEFLLALGVAVFLNRRFFGKKILIPILLLPLMVTPAVSGKIWQYLFNGGYGLVPLFFSKIGLGAVNFLANPTLAMIGVMIQDIWHWTPFLMLLFYTGLLSLPKEPFEAAAIDGASSWQKFKDITIPLLRRIFIIGILIRAMDAFKIFDEIYNMTEGGPGDATEVINYYIYKYTFKYFNMGEAAAMALVVFVIIMVLSNIFNEVMRKRPEKQAQ